MTTKDFRNLRLKKDKTEVENLMLKYREKLINISEVLIAYDKWHLTPISTVYKIKEEIDDILNRI